MTALSLPAKLPPVVPGRRVDDPRPEILAGVSLAALFFAGFVGWTSFARLDAAAFGVGQVSAVGGPQAVQSRDGGVILSLHVKEGDRVSKGELLAEISAPDVQQAARSLTGQVFAQRALIARLQAEQTGASLVQPWPGMDALSPADRADAERAIEAEQRALSASLAADQAQRGALASRITQSAQQIDGAQHQIGAMQIQSQLVASELAGMRSLAAKGYAPRVKIDQLEESAANLDGEMGAHRSDVARLNAAIGETRLQIANYRFQRLQDIADKLRAAQEQLRTLEPQLSAARGQVDRALIKAPLDGAVFNLTANTVGGVVMPGEKLMQVVPSKVGVVVEARIAAQDAAEVRVDEEAQVRFPSFHERNMPTIHGRVTSVSADSYADQRTGARFYLVQVRVEDRDLGALRRARGTADVLKPGLPSDVSITLRKRSALEYAFEPLVQAFGHSFHER